MGSLSEDAQTALNQHKALVLMRQHGLTDNQILQIVTAISDRTIFKVSKGLGL